VAAFSVEPIGHVRGGRDVPEDDHWGSSEASIQLDPERFTNEALEGLESFSHAEVIFFFDRVGEGEIAYGARHPRGRKDWPKVGIFAQRGKNRPNRIGVSVCRIVRVEGLTVVVRGLDAIDRTPIIDIKPVMSEFAPREEVCEPAWAKEMMAGYW